MLYNSTQNAKEVVSAAQAIAQGISKDGGLFVPQEFPKYDENTFKALLKTDYKGRAKKVFSDFLSDFTEEEISDCVEKAYTAQKFGGENPAPISYCNLDGTTLNILELWHGPTCAFKDMALQILPHLLTKSLKKKYDGKTAVILVATSGDTGKAALEGFKDVEGTEIMVFYPEDGVSDMQKRQMVTQEGSNVNVCAVKGNFDDCQSGVKKIFTDKTVKEELAAGNMRFSSANSINWGRLVPQIVYYVSSYVTLVQQGELQMGETLNVVVPTGNFGNILAAYYAKQMGVPLGKLICASNINKVLTDFINTGVYNRNREFYATCSPSMDILISSNLERLLYLLTGEDDAQIREWFTALSETGTYEVTDAVKTALQKDFFGGFCDDAATKATIHQVYETYGYTCDTHTAVAVKVYQDYRKATGDTTKTLIASTASPYKFSPSVLEAIAKEPVSGDEYAMVDQLHELSNLPIPAALADLKNKERRFTSCIDKNDLQSFVLQQLHLG